MARFAQRLLELRNKNQLSQSAVSKAVGITTRTYQRYESGEREATVTTLVRMADFYGITLDDLVGREPPSGGPLSHR